MSDLIAALRQAQSDRIHDDYTMAMAEQAADRIEALEAEVERLKDKCDFWAAVARLRATLPTTKGEDDGE